MKDAKYKYKLAVRDAVRVYENRFSDDLYEHFLAKDMMNFWKVWSAKTCKHIMSVSCVDGKTDYLDTANVFREKFNSVIGAGSNNYTSVSTPMSEDVSFLPWKLTTEEVDKVIFCYMKHGKAAGFDNPNP